MPHVRAAGTDRRTLGRYQLLDLIGRGSTTEAYRAKSFGVEGFEKTLVVKRLLPELSASEDFLAVFVEQVQRAMRLSHANLAQVFDLGRAESPGGETYFLATEYVSGLDVATLAERCRAPGSQFPAKIAAYLCLEVAKALDHAHRRRDDQLRPLGLVHGAIAPHNVLVSFDGDVKLTDFGVARAGLAFAGARESLKRSYEVLSPEQARGHEPSAASDVFSLGAFLYSVLAGVPPFVGVSADEVLQAAERGKVEPLEAFRADLPPAVLGVVARALARDPAERYPTISALYEELLASVYASSLRCTSAELSEFLDRHREAPSTVPGESIDNLLSRPLTVPPEPPASDPSGDPVGSSPRPSVPSFTGFGETRHVSLLVLMLRQPGTISRNAEERLRAAIDRYGGVIAHATDHEVTALFGLDRADGRDTESAARCGLVLARTLDVGNISPSVGITAGRLKLSSGRVPELDERMERLATAARSLAQGEGRVVRVSRRVVPELRGRFSIEPLGSAFRVTEFAQDGFSDAFVGRKPELQRLGEVLAGSARGALRIVRLVGEPGIGKTRLAVEVQRRLSRGSIDLQTYFATCPPRGRELPQSGTIAMLRRVCGVRDGDPAERIEALSPRLRALGLDAGETRAVLSELTATVTSGRAPASPALRSGVLRMMHSLAEDRFTVFVWDDAHELDRASADLVARAASRLTNSRITFVLAGRAETSGPFRDLPAHLEIPLRELDAADIGRLVADRIGVARAPDELLRFLEERAGGQPMFVEELLRELQHAGALQVEDGQVTSLSFGDGALVTRTLRALVGDRLRRLSDDEGHLFVAAAVLEPPVAADVLARMVGLPLSVVDSIAESLVGKGLLSRDGVAAFGFPSRLPREVVLAELEADDLSRLHRRAADAHLQAVGDRFEEEADHAGYHLAAAGERDAAADLYARGGFHALSHRMLDRAALDLSYALELTDLDFRSTAQIESWLGALAASIRYVRTGPNLPALVERIARRTLGLGVDPSSRAKMRLDLASVLAFIDRQVEGEALLDTDASDVEATPFLSMSYLAARAEFASDRGDFRLARRALDPLSRMTVTDTTHLHRISLSMARTLAATGKTEAARAALGDAARIAAPEDALLALDRAVARTDLFESSGGFREAAESAVHAASQAEELGLLYEVASSLSEQASALARLGDFDRADAAAASALSAAEEAGAERVVARCMLVRHFLEGHDTSSLELQRQQIALVEGRGWLQDALLGRLLLGRMALRAGRREDARRELVLAVSSATTAGNRAYADQLADELNAMG